MRGLHLGNIFYHVAQNILISRVLSKNENIKTSKITILPVVLYRVKLGISRYGKQTQAVSV
jgi:hypothetical protein